MEQKPNEKPAKTIIRKSGKTSRITLALDETLLEYLYKATSNKKDKKTYGQIIEPLLADHFNIELIDS